MSTAEESYTKPGKYDRHFTVPIDPFLDGTSDDVGNITIDSDQPDQGGNYTAINGFWLKARAGNSGVCRFSFDSATDSDGFELSAKEVIQVQVQNLNELWFTADTVGDKISWLKY